jgi:hypothetical protein
MEDDLKKMKMEDDINYFENLEWRPKKIWKTTSNKNGRQLKETKKNGRQPEKKWKWKTALFFFDNLNKNGRRPQINTEDDLK